MTPSEIEVKNRLEQHLINVLKSGCPDFLCWDKKKICFVEVKAGKDQVQLNQARFIKTLREHKIPFFLIRKNLKGELEGLKTVLMFFYGKKVFTNYRWHIPKRLAAQRWAQKDLKNALEIKF